MNDLELVKQKVSGASKTLNETSGIIRESLEKFYYQIAFFSGGAIVLSITYLGYLNSIPGYQIKCLALLISSWIGLFISLVSSLLRNYHHTDLMHYEVVNDYLKSVKEMNESIIAFARENPNNIQVVDGASADELDELIDTRTKENKKFSEIMTKNSVGKKVNLRWVLWTGRITHFTFILSLATLIMFAVCNTINK